MKPTTAILLLLLSLPVFSQVNGDWITSGQLKLRVNADGQLATYNNAASSELPAGSNNHLFKFINVWVSGYDNDAQLHIASVNGFSHKTDYSAGPIDSLTYAGADPQAWNTIWNVTSSQINEHRKNFLAQNYVPIDAIKTWPAMGNGRFNKYLAPFIDYNRDGLYQPEMGDYPDIMGNQACYFILNDNYSEHKASGGQPLKLETYGMLYSIDGLSDVVFAKYYVVNRTDKDFRDVFVSLHTAFELGNDKDNYCGSLVSKNLAFAYNGDADDENHFGKNNPLAGTLILDKNIASMLYISNDTNSQTGMPVTPFEHRYFMEGKWKSAKILTYGNNGLGTGKPARYVYPGTTDPDNASDNWIENQAPGERSLLTNLSYLTLPSKGFIELNFALFGQISSTGNPYTILENKANDILKAWQKNVLNTDKGVTQMATFSIPNPVEIGQNLFTDWFTNFDKISLINGLGQTVQTMNPKVENELICLTKGIHYLRFQSNNQSITKKVIII